MMPKLFKYLTFVLTCTVLLGLVSCHDDVCIGDPEPAEQQKLVITLFSPGGLGDRGYNDQILKGLQTVHKDRSDCAMLLNSPSSMEDAERIFHDWLETPSDGTPCFFILASVEYEEMANRILAAYNGDMTNKAVLLFETATPSNFPSVYTFKIDMYGASYLAGITAAEMGKESPMTLLASATDREIRTAADGFADGYASQTDRDVELDWLSDDWHGYTMSQEAYEQMPAWSANHDFIFPVAGGSNLGVYRYLRENPDGPHVAGMDIDQSPFCNQVVGSVVKHIDRLVADGVTAWLDEPTREDTHWDFGLESGYIDWQVSERYANLKDMVQKHRKEAEEMEALYKMRK